jgi:uncharacterized short protein YbdD (DUF466 family)
MQEVGIDISSHWAKDSAEFFRERQNARYAIEHGRFKGCC